MIVGTAGHIDHGKTALVRALTGVDTDRLKEEKARGISIELGYAYTPLPGGGVLGIIDVPGHERFVHTMASGAVGIDHALLVVAADDGVMPQTREHLAILQLLGVRTATVALNKADRVPPERLAAVRGELSALLQDTPFADAPVFATDALRAGDAGVAALLAHLQQIGRAMPARASEGYFRLAVDRVFTLAGHGTVVTGTVFSGVVDVGGTVTHSASGRSLRVRSLHVNGHAGEQGAAGQRCALNLVGIERADIERGDWFADARALQPSLRLDTRLRLLPDAAALAPWTPLHVHLGTTRRLAHAVPLSNEHLAAGQEARVQLVFEQPVFAWPGDRLVVRNAQASRTLGGGVVLDPFAPERRRRSAERMAYLDAMERLLADGDSSALVAQAPAGLPLSRLALLRGRPPDSFTIGPGVMAVPPAAPDPLLLAPQHWARRREQVLSALARHHEIAPDEPGVNAARLRRMAFGGAAASEVLWQAVRDALMHEGHLASTGPWLHLPGHALALTTEEQTLARRLGSWMEEGGLDPPWVRELAARATEPEERVRSLLRKLARQGEVFQVVKDLFYTRANVERLVATLRELASHHARGEVAAAEYRDATGLGRKRAIQVLEFFDRAGITRRVRDAHVWVQGSEWPGSA